jgi:hypothetical protein
MIAAPANMALLGDRNWSLPRWLTWLPGMRIEGTTATFAEGKASDGTFGFQIVCDESLRRVGGAESVRGDRRCSRHPSHFSRVPADD